MKWHVCLFAVSLISLSCAKEDFHEVDSRESADFHQGVFGGDEVNTQDPISQTTVGVYHKVNRSLCTGSLYGSNMVITAAHCLKGSVTDLEVRFGLSMRRPLLKRHVISGERNPRFKNTFVANRGDIALIRYEGSLPVEYGFRSVSLLKDPRVLKKGTPVIAAGYGVKKPTLLRGAGILRKVTLEMETPQFSETEASVKQGFWKGVCVGDSGGPAFVRAQDGRLYLWGLTSYGGGIPKLRSCIYSTVFTRVDAYLSWLDATSGRLACGSDRC